MADGAELDARTVWHAWRRVMREEAVREAMFAGTLAERADALGLSPADREVIERYAETPAGTRFFIANYRYRMTSSFINALETAAPLTHRLLRANGVDIDALAERFLDSVGWRDFGPYVYTYGGRVLEFLRAHPEVGGLHGLADLAALESAAVAVTVRAAHSPPDFTPRPGVYAANDAVTSVTTELDVSGWLRGGQPGVGVLPAGPRTFLVYLSPPDLRRRIVAVPESAVALVRGLAVPRAAGEMPAGRLVEKLVALGVVIAPGSD
ncbi:hypothetical protein [Actinokineospora fastidiosa]|uniref:DUF2063 domain-containing protein n=1 Tax=Actinokineospora fastidiosa TaxID=1816 RepID=A0A918G9E0_9PSEU|nr:hypothetical protein [Actinokineospora fastidiosa]GGS24746.1 hypothetical protein GCM10010171_17430 [Actinokineospora fastidiosa]